MVTSLLVRCTYVWLIGWAAVSSVMVTAVLTSQNGLFRIGEVIPIGVFWLILGVAALFPMAVGKVCIGKRALWQSAWRNLKYEHPVLSSPIARVFDASIAILMVIVTLIPVYAIYWSCAHQVALFATAFGFYETGERISRAVRVSERWNDVTMTAIADLELNVDDSKTLRLNEAIATVYGPESKQMAQRYKLLGDRAMRAGAETSPERMLQAQSWYQQSVDLYRNLTPSASFAEALAKLANCRYYQGNRAASYNCFSDALYVVSLTDPRYQPMLFKRVYSIGRNMGIRDPLPRSYRSAQRAMMQGYHLDWIGRFALIMFGLVTLRTYFPLVVLARFSETLITRLRRETSTQRALADLDNLATVSLCLHRMPVAEEASKVMLKLAETDDVTVVSTFRRERELVGALATSCNERYHNSMN
jgi:hypothetical protein